MRATITIEVDLHVDATLGQMREIRSSLATALQRAPEVADVQHVHVSLELPKEQAWPKACGCGASYTREEFYALPYVGIQDDGTERAVLRNCRCRSTISALIPAGCIYAPLAKAASR